jgi:hypothetical protein
MNFDAALNLVRLLIAQGIPRDQAISNPAIPEEHRTRIQETLERDDNIILEPARMLVAAARRDEWLRQRDRSEWYYWPRLREYLLAVKGWHTPAVRSLDEITDRILGQLSPPEVEQFDVRGLVLGYVQSGKTASYTALIAKAADVGYRLIIVLSGIDNGLRRQTQIRLKRELVGYADNRPGAVHLPPWGQHWHEFTQEHLEGDFRPGFANHAALQLSQPVLLVVKKNQDVLRRLNRWLNEAPEEVRRMVPLLVIDDEADQASVDTRGTYQTDEDPRPADYEPPTRINGLIRELLNRFQRRAYVAYTATPFANILIPHDTYDPTFQNDLYPRDFIVDLPKPEAYFGAEELFGRFDPATGENVGGLDLIRDVTPDDLLAHARGELPITLETAFLDFVLAGSARAYRGQRDEPATMLIHISHRVMDQQQIETMVSQRFSELKDEWRYQRDQGIRDRLRSRWEQEFRPVTRAAYLDRDAGFEAIESHVGPFFEAVQIKVINSDTGDVLDYEREPGLKAIAIGGNRLSRGLTLEGLVISYFVRRSTTYDTLMQMGRWFGFRRGYDDLVRIFTTPELSGWFSDMAFVEYCLREDLRVYEDQNLTPEQMGTRILEHSAMQVTSALKRRFSSSITISQSYSLSLQQTIKFPLGSPNELVALADQNLQTVRAFLGRLSGLAAPCWRDTGPLWSAMPPEEILDFLRNYRVAEDSSNLSLPLVCAYIERQVELGELQRWTVAVRGRRTRANQLGEADWGVDGGHIWQMARTRIRNTNSLGVITEPGDEAMGLSEEALATMRQFQAANETENRAARRSRPPEEGLLLLYPISRHSGQEPLATGNRRPLFENPQDSRARDLIGLALSFPQSRNPQVVAAYLVGTAGWMPVE